MSLTRPLALALTIALVACDGPVDPDHGPGRMILSGDTRIQEGFTAVIRATGVRSTNSGQVFALGEVTFASRDTAIARVLSVESVGNFNQRFEARVVTRAVGNVDIDVRSTRAGEGTWLLEVVPCPTC